jgi:hypothetical protein
MIDATERDFAKIRKRPPAAPEPFIDFGVTAEFGSVVARRADETEGSRYAG